MHRGALYKPVDPDLSGYKDLWVAFSLQPQSRRGKTKSQPGLKDLYRQTACKGTRCSFMAIRTPHKKVDPCKNKQNCKSKAGDVGIGQ